MKGGEIMTDKNNEEVTEIINGGNEGGTNKSSTGLDENIAALLCYLATAVSGIILLLIEKKSEFVRFHAMQSTVLFIGIWVLRFAFDYVPFIGWFLVMLTSLLGVILWIVLMVKAYQNEYYKLPVIGDLSEDFLKKLKPKADA